PTIGVFHRRESDHPNKIVRRCKFSYCVRTARFSSPNQSPSGYYLVRDQHQRDWSLDYDHEIPDESAQPKQAPNQDAYCGFHPPPLLLEVFHEYIVESFRVGDSAARSRRHVSTRPETLSQVGSSSPTPVDVRFRFLSKQPPPLPESSRRRRWRAAAGGFVLDQKAVSNSNQWKRVRFVDE